ncbi:MAG: M56 family metallopeptidase [Chitinophagales bacterium]
MVSLFADSILGETIVRSICWTLIHSLWQGLLLALAAGLLLILTKKSNPALRYNGLTILLFIFISVNVYTLYWQISSRTGIQNESRTMHDQPLSGSQDGDYKKFQSQGLVPESRPYERLQIFLNDQASLVVTLWFIAFCAQLLRLLTGINYMKRIRQFKVHPPSAYWKNRVSELADKLGIRGDIELLQSELVKVPMMAGYFKPIILFPIGIMLQLPHDQVEAVLLHELAHIKRRDFFINMIQQIVRLFYFFNPGLLWISSLIHEERENCCDDIAIRILGNSKPFISALVAFQEMKMTNPEYALAFPGRKNQLLQRIKRILYSQNQTLNTMEKIFLTGCILLVGLGPIALSQTTNTKLAIADKEHASAVASSSSSAWSSGSGIETGPTAASSLMALADTVPVSKSSKTTTVSKDGKITYVKGGYKIVTRGDDQILEAYYNGKKLSKEEINAKKSQFQKLMKEQDEDWLKSSHEFAEAAQLQELKSLQDHQNLATLYLASLDAKRNAELMQLDAMKMHLQLQDDPKLQELNMKMAELQKQMNELQTERVKLEAETQAQLYEKLVQDQKQANQLRNLAPVDQIIELLKDKKIVSDGNELSFELNNEEFIVNKVKQPKEIHTQFKGEFLKGPKDHVIYSTNGHSTHTDVSIND